MTAISNESEKVGKELTIAELQELTNSFDTKTEKAPIIDWSHLIGTFLSPHQTIKSQFDQGRKIYIEDMNYLESMLKFLYETNPRSLYCALWWHVVRNSILNLTPELRALESNYRKQVVLKDESREEYCLASTVTAYGYTVAYNYIMYEETNQNIKLAVDLFRNFYGSVVSLIRSQTDKLLDPKTVMAAVLRLDSSNFVFGLPDHYNSANGLNSIFGNVIFHESNYFFSQFFQNRDNIRLETELLDESIHFEISDPLAESSETNIQLNSIAVPLVFTQFPFVGNGLISLTVGSLIMPFFREVFHTFDASASEYNVWGEKENWWTKKVLKNYLKEAECFVTSYGEICFDEGCVDGKRTLHENIADNAAFKAAIETYKNIEKNIAINSEGKKEPKLIDFETFSHLRLLTLSFAISMCQRESPEKLSEILKTDKYPPPSVRVNQVLKNSPEFAKIWGCPEGSPMNPAKKCQLW